MMVNTANTSRWSCHLCSDSCSSEEEEDLKEDIDINNIIKLDRRKVNGITYF